MNLTIQESSNKADLIPMQKANWPPKILEVRKGSRILSNL